MVKIAPSILAADFENLENEIKDVEQAGADYIHIDVMDGEFVTNKTPGLEMLKINNAATDLILDTHLMVENPIDWIEDFSESDIITFHIEATDEETASKIIEELHEKEIKVGISIKPNTAVEEILPYIDKIDMVLVMTVEPGKGGQKLIPECLEKVRILRELAPDIDIEVDGGINIETVGLVKEAGANVIVAGTAVFGAEDRKFVIDKLRGDIKDEHVR